MQEIIAARLAERKTKLVDLFREWDSDGGGKISKTELTKGLKKLGIDATDESLMSLFDSWDRDKSGELDYKELSKALKGSDTVESAAQVKKRAMVARQEAYNNARAEKERVTRDQTERVAASESLREAAAQGDVAEANRVCTDEKHRLAAIINMTDLLGNTALMKAAMYGHAECIDFLVSKGASVDDADEGGRAALMLASVNGEVSAIRALLAAGASIALRDKRFGWRAFEYAIVGGHTDGVRVLADAHVHGAVRADGLRADVEVEEGVNPFAFLDEGDKNGRGCEQLANEHLSAVDEGGAPAPLGPMLALLAEIRDGERVLKEKAAAKARENAARIERLRQAARAEMKAATAAAKARAQADKAAKAAEEVRKREEEKEAKQQKRIAVKNLFRRASANERQLAAAAAAASAKADEEAQAASEAAAAARSAAGPAEEDDSACMSVKKAPSLWAGLRDSRRDSKKELAGPSDGSYNRGGGSFKNDSRGGSSFKGGSGGAGSSFVKRAGSSFGQAANSFKRLSGMKTGWGKSLASMLGRKLGRQRQPSSSPQQAHSVLAMANGGAVLAMAAARSDPNAEEEGVSPMNVRQPSAGASPMNVRFQLKIAGTSPRSERHEEQAEPDDDSLLQA